jgi:hypothetical protein
MYGDEANLEPTEIAAARNWLKAIGLGAPVDIINGGQFARDYDYCDAPGTLAEICTYVFFIARSGNK